MDSLTEIFSNPLFLTTFKVLFKYSYIWLPILLGSLAWTMWVDYRRQMFVSKQTFILLEIKLPREILKSPQASEFFISGLYSTLGEGNWYEKYWKGSVRDWFSLEMVSIDGIVHFFIWTKGGNKNKIEANLYSQYPGIEVYEVPDYTLPVKYDPETMTLFGTEFKLNKPDAYPIKTYLDYGMDKNPKEE